MNRFVIITPIQSQSSKVNINVCTYHTRSMWHFVTYLLLSTLNGNSSNSPGCLCSFYRSNHNFRVKPSSFSIRCVVFVGTVDCTCSLAADRLPGRGLWERNHNASHEWHQLVIFCYVLLWVGATWFYSYISLPKYIDGFVQERHNSSVLALDLRLSSTNPLIWLRW